VKVGLIGMMVVIIKVISMRIESKGKGLMYGQMEDHSTDSGKMGK